MVELSRETGSKRKTLDIAKADDKIYVDVTCYGLGQYGKQKKENVSHNSVIIETPSLRLHLVIIHAAICASVCHWTLISRVLGINESNLVSPKYKC